jgi:carbon storage regulator CsrA
MLVLSRKHNESLILTLPTGEIVKITVMRPLGYSHQVRLAFDAPPSVRIWRSELSGPPGPSRRKVDA